MATDNFGNTYVVTEIMPPGEYYYLYSFTVAFSKPFYAVAKIKENGDQDYLKLLFLNNETLSIENNIPVIAVQPHTGL